MNSTAMAARISSMSRVTGCDRRIRLSQGRVGYEGGSQAATLARPQACGFQYDGPM